MGIGNEVAKGVIPGLAPLEAVGHVAGNFWRFGMRHPKVAAVLGATSALAALGVVPFVDGVRQSIVDFETKTTVESNSNGYGEIIDLKLEPQPHPLIAYTAEVTDVKTTISHDTQATILGKTVSIPSWQGDVWVTSDTTVDTTINYDPIQMKAVYDPGKINDKTDDQIIVTVPLGAFSTTVSAEPTTKPPQISSDFRNLPANLVSTYAKDFTKLRSLPGVTTVENVTDQTAQTLIYTNQIKSLNNVATTCTAELTKNDTVYSAIKKNIANEVMLAISKSKDPTLTEKTVAEVNAMTVVIRIGDETKANPQILSQKLNTINSYTDTYNEIKNNKLYVDNTDGKFTCEISDAVKKIIADSGSTGAPTTTDGQTPQAKATP